MEPIHLIVIGAGGHAKVILDMLLPMKAYRIVGLVDSEHHGETHCGIPVLNEEDALPLLTSQGVRHAVLALGDNQRRQHVATSFNAMEFEFINVISPHAYVSPQAVLGQGVCVMAGAVIQPFAVVHDHVIINTGATIDHDCNIGAFSHIAPGSTLAGAVTLGVGCFLGVGTKVIPNIVLGDWVEAAAGSVITQSFASHQRVKGVPARPFHG